MKHPTPALVLLSSLAALSLLAAAEKPEPPQEAPSLRFEKVLNRMVDSINRRDYPAIQKDFSRIMLDAFPLEKSKPFFTNLLATYGKIRKLDPPRLTPPNQAVFPARCERGILDIKIVLDNYDKIVGLWFLPHVPSVPVPDRHNTKLDLPFKGRWLVFWGGDTKQLNQHHDVPSQKFAFDFLGADPRGKTRRSNGLSNQDYFAFGREILAPADGIVTDVIRGVRDNKPGSMNPYSALGNAVFIRHRPNEVSVLAHFKFDSITVNVGDRVKRGQILGLCGNSGNSSEPHLHYHLQNTPIIQDATGIKCFFDNLTLYKDAKPTPESAYSPVKGNIIASE
jgi:hypothetical protein